jgi:hypothetical protein
MKLVAESLQEYSSEPKIRINSYRSLSSNAFGRMGIQKYNLPPFIDGSCRKEPDLESKFPSITSTCRKGKFCPILNIGDITVYLTIYKGMYLMTAILEVIEKFNSHEEGASWYLGKGLPLPSNCMVPENPPKPIEMTTGRFDTLNQMNSFLSLPPQIRDRKGEAIIRVWNNDYMKRVREFPQFVITKPIYLDVWNPISISPSELRQAFNGKIPGTQNPRKLKAEEYQFFLDII